MRNASCQTLFRNIKIADLEPKFMCEQKIKFYSGLKYRQNSNLALKCFDHISGKYYVKITAFFVRQNEQNTPKQDCYEFQPIRSTKFDKISYFFFLFLISERKTMNN
jgi:hypothetical protein